MASKVFCRNKKAFHDFHIEETLEAGIELTGSEVKSIRLGRINLKDSFARIIGGEAFLFNVHISPYTEADTFARHEPERKRKLLLHKREILKLLGKTKVKGFTIVPTKFYLRNGKIKVEIALARGKTSYDKRETIKKKEADREVSRAMRHRLKGN